ncbi:heavy metal translocating P-type ATPase [Ornithinimicrobium pekingense]|uniref:Cobalt ABC transporter ATP-binding protein n=1 Tax=Ornithinimicrobium pekingense TaxID=384677 RepID=A0ABQ2FBL7_9MICO|nr:heavy metal translocating P-type ATPase [Ornithinimicrobium pekingense]GGK71663.1 cobalt ABC transporter ATP-binding protein [Ornithinimicrobium pekingense]
MGAVAAAVRRHPVVGLTLILLALVLGLLVADQEPVARWVASLYVVLVIARTGAGMVRDVLRGHYGLDILAVVAMIATVAVEEYVAAVIIVLMLSGGEALEEYAAARARAELTTLLARAPQVAHRIPGARADGTGADGTTGTTGTGTGDPLVEDLPVDAVEPQDVLLVRPAEVVPVDGVLLDEEATFDESSLTGESLPVVRGRGDTVLSGALNGTRAVRMRATARAADSQYQGILRLVARAEENKAPTVRVADRFAVPFTAVSLLVAGLAWWLSGDPVRFAEVLVLATPCPLLIAAPVAFLGGTSRAAHLGIVVKGGGTLEALARARSVAFDKTGTLSRGEPELVRVDAAPGTDPDELLRLAASAEQHSSHVLAEGVIRAARRRGLALAEAVDGEELATHGVTATVEGRQIVVGKLQLVRETDPTAYPAELGAGQTAVSVAVGGRFAGNLVLADPLRPNAAATVQVLRDLGIRDVVVLTGDNRTTAVSLAADAGVEPSGVHAELLPQDKVRIVTAMPHRPVVMVGDGINDAPVLAAADVGIAMGARGATAASEAADVVITRDDIGKVVQAVEVGRHTYRVALTAIWIGVVLSLGLMVVAAFGHIPAVAGALTQELVDLAAILYALMALRPGRGHQEVVAPAAEREPVRV